jgi:DNA-binding NarL/FixJ family response regulator
MEHNAAMRVLLVTADHVLVDTFTDLSNELGIVAQQSDQEYASDQLDQAKYEGVVVDLDTIKGASPLLSRVRESRSNKTTIVFAVATRAELAQQALAQRAHFLIRRPFDTSTMRQTLSAAYDLMRIERRRYFRCSANLRVHLRTSSGEQIDCSTLNVSNTGMAVLTDTTLKTADAVELVLFLPTGFIVQATAIVIWDDKHGKSGLHFQCPDSAMRQQLESWLDSQAKTC